MNNKETSRSVQKFQHPLLGSMRVARDEAGKEWFCLGDVAECLGMESTSKLKRRLKVGGITTIHIPCLVKNQHCKQGTTMQEMTYIDEANLYRCIFQSRKSKAEAFQDWVFEVVLPNMRRGALPGHEPAPIAGVRPLYYCGEWYYGYSELCHAIGYTENGARGKRSRTISFAKRFENQVIRMNGAKCEVRLISKKLANLLAEIRAHEVAKEEALFRFACENNPASN